MPSVNDIKAYAQGSARNRIVLCNSRIEGLTYIDVGYELSLAIGNACDATNFESLLREIFSRSQHDGIIGQYLALDNIGILFEDDLHIHLESIFDSYSKGQTLLICAEGELENNTFKFMSSDRCKVNIGRLSFIRIEKTTR